MIACAGISGEAPHARRFLPRGGLVREASIALAPTWVAFHPWSTLDSYLDLLTSLVVLRLVGAVPPVQLMIRLLIPSGSKAAGVAGLP